MNWIQRLLARLGTPAGASVSADIATVDGVADSIETKVGTNVDAAGTTTLFARLKQIVDTYLADGTIGLAALEALVDDLETRLGVPVTSIAADIADLITRAKGLDEIHDDVAALVMAATGPGYPVDSLNLLDHFNRKDTVAPDPTLWTPGGHAGFSVAMSVVDGEPSMIELVTPATTDEEVYINSNGTLGRVFSLNEDGITVVTFEARVKLVDATYLTCRFGLAKAGFTAYSPIPDGMFFSTFAPSGAGGNWYGRNNDTAFTETDTGVAPDTDWHIFKIVWTATSIKFYIDDVEKVEHNVVANFPTAPLLVGAVGRAEENVAKHLRIDYINVGLS